MAEEEALPCVPSLFRPPAEDSSEVSPPDPQNLDVSSEQQGPPIMPPVMAAPSAADAAESPLEDAVDKKDEGNTMFKLKKYKLAVRCYESALDAIPKKTKTKKVK